jgi:predicted sugar kinase
LPEAWRVVLARPYAGRGLAGDYETNAFECLPAVAEEVTRELWRIAERELLPALERSDCAAFGEALYRFGRLAGECFSAVQGGPFASAEIGRLIDAIRGHGVPGAAQSSWGPTVFAFTASDAEAQALAEWLQTALGVPGGRITIARPNNSGAQISTLS